MLLQERNGALSEKWHTNPHLGHSHPVSVEVANSIGKKREGAAQLPRTRTIRLSTLKTNLISELAAYDGQSLEHLLEVIVAVLVM